jgi:hypothetical protein
MRLIGGVDTGIAIRGDEVGTTLKPTVVFRGLAEGFALQGGLVP